MNPHPISFIIPAYNCAATIEESVRSILETNFQKGDEIIIVDDKSTDQTLSVIKQLASHNPAIRIVEHAENQGGGAARNTAVKNSKNDLIFCLDSDNVLAKNSIAPLKHFLIATKSDAANFGKIKFFRKNTRNITHIWKYKDGHTILSDMFYSPIIPPSSGNYLFTKKSWAAAGEYPEFSGALDTWGFGFRQLSTGSRMTTMPRSYYFHRHGHDSYWIRDSRNAGISSAATKIIAPYYDLLNSDLVKYIQNHPDTWFDTMDEMPHADQHVIGKSIIRWREKFHNMDISRILKRIYSKIISDAKK